MRDMNERIAYREGSEGSGAEGVTGGGTRMGGGRGGVRVQGTGGETGQAGDSGRPPWKKNGSKFLKENRGTSKKFVCEIRGWNINQCKLTFQIL